MNRFSRILVSTVVAAGLVTAGSSAALARGGDKTVGTCTAGSSIKASNTANNGLREIDFEVDQNRAGVTWSWKIASGATTLSSGTAVTRKPSGAFSVRQLVSASGAVTVTATRAGETCTVTV